eukprot:scaffold1047_cov138-Amphora_coffeaeformis.AAC.2
MSKSSVDGMSPTGPGKSETVCFGTNEVPPLPLHLSWRINNKQQQQQQQRLHFSSEQPLLLSMMIMMCCELNEQEERTRSDVRRRM